ncbi:MAG: hypothetical protein ASARMPRED_003519 [Alectoria sarmentosa]|nr:MAG: hypothetical protein ASARMPRED_003519 [Alectoria sarmentosa]
MMLSRQFHLSAILAVLVSISVALSISSPPNKDLPLDLINITNSSLKEPLGHLPNLTFAPWPPQPYQIQMYLPFALPDLTIIRAREFHGSRPVSVPRLQEFLRQFRDNIAQESPIPGFVPRMARQSTIDILSYTAWRIELNEGLFGHRLPTEIAILVLDEIAKQLGIHGPTYLFFSITEGISTDAYGFLEIEEFGGGVSLNGSLADGDNVLQTA